VQDADGASVRCVSTRALAAASAAKAPVSVATCGVFVRTRPRRQRATDAGRKRDAVDRPMEE